MTKRQKSTDPVSLSATPKDGAGEHHWLDALVLRAPLAMIVVDQTNVVCLGNHVAAKIFGRTVDSLPGLAVGDLIAAHSRGAFLERLSMAFGNHPNPDSVEAYLQFQEALGLSAKGSEIPIEVGLSVVESPSSERLVTLLVLDSRERHASQERLRASEERFRRLTALSSDFFWEMDEELRFTFISQRDVGGAIRLLRDRFLGRRFWEVNGAQPTSFRWQDLQAFASEHKPFRHLVYSLTLDDDLSRYYSISGEPIFSSSGQFTGYRGVASDVTDVESTRQERLEREQAQVRALQEELDRYRGEIGSWSSLPVGDALYGSPGISGAAPEEFAKLVARYRELLEVSLEARVLKLNAGTKETVRILAEDLGRWGAGARDVIEIHQRAIAIATEALAPLKAEAFLDEARYVVLELMGRLVMFYRRNSSGFRGNVQGRRGSEQKGNR